MKIRNNIFKQDRNLSEPSAFSRISAVTLIIIMAAAFTLFSLNECPAHEGEKLQQAKAAVDNQTPFSIILPNNLSKYMELLKPPRTITMRSGLVRLNPGEDVGLHSTNKNEEMLVILEGQGEVELEGHTPLKISGGQVAYVPPETRHNVHNTGSVPLKYIFIVSRAIES
jgi:mannose-6-phosphate isomerase-like protein (cupin superfamily)